MADPIAFGTRYTAEALVFAIGPLDSDGALVTGVLESAVTLEMNDPDDNTRLKADGLTWVERSLPGLYYVTSPAGLQTKAGYDVLYVTHDSAAFPVQRVVLEVVGARPTSVTQQLGSTGQNKTAFDTVTMDFTFVHTGLGSFTDSAVFTAKKRPTDADSAAIITIWETTGLSVLSGAAPVSPVVAGDGALTFPSASTGRVVLKARAMVGLGEGDARGLFWEVKNYDGSSPQAIQLTAAGKLKVCAGIQRDVSGAP